MKKIYDNVKTKLKQNWQHLMNSTHRRMSEGAEFVYKVMCTAHRDQWRRHEHKKSKKD